MLRRSVEITAQNRRSAATGFRSAYRRLTDVPGTISVTGPIRARKQGTSSPPAHPVRRLITQHHDTRRSRGSLLGSSLDPSVTRWAGGSHGRLVSEAIRVAPRNRERRSRRTLMQPGASDSAARTDDMLVIPKRTIGSKGGRGGSTKAGGRGYLSARMEAWCRCRVIHGMSQLQAYRSAYPAAKMGDKAAATEASRLQQHPLVVKRIRELNALLVEVDFHDRAETNKFVLSGLKRLALNGDNSSAQIAAYKLIGSLTHARLFDPPVVGTAPDTRSADTIRKALQRRVERLLPSPAAADDQSATPAVADGGQVAEDGADEGVEAAASGGEAG